MSSPLSYNVIFRIGKTSIKSNGKGWIIKIPQRCSNFCATNKWARGKLRHWLVVARASNYKSRNHPNSDFCVLCCSCEKAIYASRLMYATWGALPVLYEFAWTNPWWENVLSFDYIRHLNHKGNQGEKSPEFSSWIVMVHALVIPGYSSAGIKHSVHLRFFLQFTQFVSNEPHWDLVIILMQHFSTSHKNI